MQRLVASPSPTSRKALNLGRTPAPESMIVSPEGCSIASRTLNECEPLHLGHHLPRGIMPKCLQYKTQIWAMMLKHLRLSSPNGGLDSHFAQGYWGYVETFPRTQLLDPSATGVERRYAPVEATAASGKIAFEFPIRFCPCVLFFARAM